jgi:hypothetical protein
MADFIGVVVNADGLVIAVINPDDDSELNNSAWEKLGDNRPSKLKRVPRGSYDKLLTATDVHELIKDMDNTSS